MKLIDNELGGTTPLDIIIKFKETSNEEVIEDNDDEDLEFEFDQKIFSENDNDIWFDEDKLKTIKNIHNFLENKKEIGKVQSLHSLITIANLINKNELTIFELSILYNKIPKNYREDLINPFLSIENNMIKISARIKDSEDITIFFCF